jgi:REP element-mobilizing transposase RayT
MQTLEPLVPGKFYHIYNRGINSCNLFQTPENFEHFLRLYEKYILPIAVTYAWTLMPNHFHTLVRIKDEVVKWLNLNLDPDPSSGLPEPDEYFIKNFLNKPIYQHYSNLFNAYTKAFNKRFGRTGSLFEHPFRRKLVDDEDYFRRLVIYIHNNSVKHGFASHPIEYPWTSYTSNINPQMSRMQSLSVVEWFEDLDNFKFLHLNKDERIDCDDWS